MWSKAGFCLWQFLNVNAFLRKANQFSHLLEDRPPFDELAFSIIDHYENSYTPESEPIDVVLEPLCSSTAFNVLGYGSQSQYAPKVFKCCRDFLTTRLHRLEAESTQVISPLLIHGLRHFQLSEWNMAVSEEKDDLTATKIALYTVSQFRKLLRLKNFSLLKLKTPMLKLDRRDVPERLKSMKVLLEDLNLSAPGELKPYIHLALEILDRTYSEVHTTAKEALITKMYEEVRNVVNDVREASAFINDDIKVKAQGLPLPPYRTPFVASQSDYSSGGEAMLSAPLGRSTPLSSSSGAKAVSSTSSHLPQLIDKFNSALSSQIHKAESRSMSHRTSAGPSQVVNVPEQMPPAASGASSSYEGDMQPLQPLYLHVRPSAEPQAGALPAGIRNSERSVATKMSPSDTGGEKSMSSEMLSLATDKMSSENGPLSGSPKHDGNVIDTYLSDSKGGARQISNSKSIRPIDSQPLDNEVNSGMIQDEVGKEVSGASSPAQTPQNDGAIVDENAKVNCNEMEKKDGKSGGGSGFFAGLW